jgi:hypothetical protein
MTYINTCNCKCIQNFANSKFDLLSDTFITNLIELKLIEVKRSMDDFSDSTYHKTDLGISISNKILYDTSFNEEFNNIVKVMKISENNDYTLLQKSYCCEFTIFIAIYLNNNPK